jgi:lipopolysaccharide biosynthesis glycosyltransferase
MHVVFCADRNVLPGLHVAAYSVLEHYSGDDLVIHVFSDQLQDRDVDLLRDTLNSSGRPYCLELCRIDPGSLNKCPSLHGSWAPYFRILAAEAIRVPRFLYLDVDIVCKLDVRDFAGIDLNGFPAAFVPEGPISTSADRGLVQFLGSAAHGAYFNSGVMWVDTQAWKDLHVTDACLDYLSHGPADYWDQSALNYVLRGRYTQLDSRFNFIANKRDHWPCLKRTGGLEGTLLHLVDHPKPWDFLGEFVHPQFHIWARSLAGTAMRGYRSYVTRTARTLRLPLTHWQAYKRTLKDRLLFACYRRGWLLPKGVPAN